MQFNKTVKKHLAALIFSVVMLNSLYAQDWPPPDSVVIGTVEYDSIIYQSPIRIAIEAEAAVRLSNSADVYLKWAALPDVSNYTVRYKLGEGDAAWLSVQRSTNDLILENVPLDITVTWEVLVVGDSQVTPVYQSDIGTVSTSQQHEPIQVSHRLYSKLEGWFGKDDNNEGFCEFFRALNDIHQYEKLAFLQAYAFDNARFIKPAFPSSSDIKDWYPAATVTGTGDGDECFPMATNCKCKVISDGSNIATPNGGYDLVARKINPRSVQKIAHADEDRTTIDRFEAGAAKFISLRQSESFGGMAYAMSNLQGANDENSVTTQASEIVFFLACLTSNGGTTTNLPSACQCRRPLYVDYEYTTRLHVKAEKKNCWFSKGAEAQAEDLAFVGVYEGKTGKVTPIAANQALLTRACSSSWNPDFWINVLNLAKPVADYYLQTLDTTQSRIPTTQQVNAFIDSLKALIKTPFRNSSGTCEEIQQDKVLVSGRDSLLLRPNAPIRVGIFSSYYVRTRGYGCWRAQAGIASDYFLLGVVESEKKESEDPECCTDKFANYVLGSLSTPWNGDVKIDAVNSLENRMQDVGFLLSTYGSWDSLKRDPSSGQLLIKHQYDRLYGPSCLNYGEMNGDAEDRSRTNTTDLNSVRVYPNIVESCLNVEVNAHAPCHAQIRLVDLRGGLSKTFFLGHLEDGNRAFRFPVSDIAKGNYVVHCRLGQQDYSFKVSIL